MDRVISTDDGKKLAQSWGAHFLECSAKHNAVCMLYKSTLHHIFDGNSNSPQFYSGGIVFRALPSNGDDPKPKFSDVRQSIRASTCACSFRLDTVGVDGGTGLEKLERSWYYSYQVEITWCCLPSSDIIFITKIQYIMKPTILQDVQSIFKKIVLEMERLDGNIPDKKSGCTISWRCYSDDVKCSTLPGTYTGENASIASRELDDV